MDHYLEIQLRPDPEFPPTVLMNALFAKLHRALSDTGKGRVGVSFPAVETGPGLGDRLRLHGQTEDLQRLMALNWLTGMRDHAFVSEIRPVPANAKHRPVRRKQPKPHPERQRRRLMRRRGMDEEQARKIIPAEKGERLPQPFVTLQSRSTGQRFRLFIQHEPVTETPRSGGFSDYGLSADDKATVPWF